MGSSIKNSIGVKIKIPNYVIKQRIDRGGFGFVYKAVEVEEGRGAYGKVIAVKIPAPEEKGEFEREARIALTFNHRNVVKVYDFLKINNEVAMIMEYLGEKDLNKIIHDHHYYDYETLLYLCREVAKGLYYIHKQGIIHRDVKPNNILVSEDLKKVKITDFGFAHPPKRWWQKEIRGGTQTYASPEQKKREKLDTRSDIYSFGKVMFTLFARKLKRNERHFNPPGSMYSVIGFVKGQIPEKIEKVVMRAIRKRREKRYASMEELINDLNQC
ncbi:MAG TPA: serine/threonine protein kinase [Candidatus Omnitrophica bacterium]|nr:serine/threonine protein kinase [Candidatus Omnitrophota bacterium]